MPSRRSQISSGILAFRRRADWEVLLVHPGGPYWRNRDDGAWSIPKGVVESDTDLLAAARREFAEETGLVAQGDFVALHPVRQKSGKLVHAFAVEGDFDLSNFVSNQFEMEWPPKSGKTAAFPEADRAAYFGFDAALTKIIPYQRPMLTELRERLASEPGELEQEPIQRGQRAAPAVQGMRVRTARLGVRDCG